MHFNCTEPLPLEFLNVAPPFNFEGVGLIIILKVPVAFSGISNGGDTTVLSLPFSFLASTVQRTRKTPSASLAQVTVCGWAFSDGLPPALAWGDAGGIDPVAPPGTGRVDVPTCGAPCCTMPPGPPM